MHWATAVPFMVCYVTAVVLMTVYNAHPERPYRALCSWIHRLSGCALVIGPLCALIQHWYDVSMHGHNIREAWRWTVADVKWLFLIGPSTLSKKITLPEQGKFNAAEKLNFMVLIATVPAYAVTGLMLWLHQYFFAAWVLHLSMAAAASTLIGGHIFMATINPDTRIGLSGMITGFVDRHWASHHYGTWYRENFASFDADELSGEATAVLAPRAVPADPCAAAELPPVEVPVPDSSESDDAAEIHPNS